MSRQAGCPWLIVLALLPAPVLAQATPGTRALALGGEADPLARPARLEVSGLPLRDALVAFERQTGLKLAYSPSMLPRALVTCDCRDSSAAATLRTLLAGTGFTWYRAQDQIVVQRQERPAAALPASEPLSAAPAGESSSAAPAVEVQEPVVVSGMVSDDTGAPISGALVSVSTGRRNTITDAQGSFRLQLTEAGIIGRRDTLRVSYLGFRTAAVPFTIAAGTVRLDVRMATDALKLDEIVVTGTAGNQTRRAQPAVISRVDAAAIVERAPVANVAQVLKGRVPGIAITESGGTTGTSARINIRGAASVSLSNEPLVFIDGVRLESGQRSLVSVGGQSLSALNDLNPADIVRVEIVKGPAAATLYGADASAGVIQIFTKRGAVGARSFRQNLSYEYAETEPNFTPYTNYGTCTAAQAAAGSGHPLCEGKSAGFIISDNPLQRENAFRNGNLHTLQYNLQGGAENYGYYASFSSYDETGTVRNNEANRRTGRVNFNWTASPRVTVDAALGLARNENALPPGDQSSDGYLIAAGLGSPRTVRKLADGTLAGGWLSGTQSVQSISSIESSTRTLRITPSTQVEYRPFPWFRNRLTFGADLSNSNGQQFYPKNTQNWYSGDFANGWVRSVRSSVDLYTVDYLGNIQAAFGAGRYTSDLSAGLQYIDRTSDVLIGTGIALTTNASNLVSGAATNNAAEGYAHQKSLGFFLQEQVGYLDRLFVQLGARVDRNSSFGMDAGSFFLPKAGVSYVISQEKFFEPYRNTVSTLRLRGAWGTTGRAPTPGASLQTYASTPYITDAGTLLPGLIPLNPGNPDLKPERGTETELGLDAGFFNDRVGLELTYFNKRTTDLLLQVPQPPSSGFTGGASRPYQNIGEVLNRGLEFMLRATPVNRANVVWEAQVQGGTLHNEIVSLGDVQPFTNSYRTFRPGEQIGSWFVNRIRSIDSANSRVIVSDTAELLGHQMPDLEGSISSTLTLFRNVRVYAQLDGKRGYRVYNLGQEYRDRYFGNSAKAVLPADQGGYSAMERLRRFGPYVSEKGGRAIAFTEVKEDYIQEADFLRLSEVSATFTLPASLAGRVRASSASLTLAGRNLHLWSKFPGYDPEILGTGPGTAGSTFYDQFYIAEVFTLPPTRRWVARVNVQF